MSDALTITEQIREAKRVRILGESYSDLLTSRAIAETGFPPNFLLEKQLKISKHPIPTPTFEWRLIPAKDPFDLSFEDFEKLNPNESEELLKRAYELCTDLIRDAWISGYRQIVLCNKKIVFKSSNEEAIPSDTIKRLAKRYNKACYVFSAPDIIEESIWTPISGDDSYPTLKIYVGSDDSDEKEIIEKSSPILADLDTGNPFYKIFDANQLSKSLQEFSPFELREGEHLGCAYTYYNKRVKICAQDVDGNMNSFVCLVRVVRNWDRCAVVQVSPRRTGFVGRDLLRALRIRLKIDPLKNISQILDVS